MTQPPAPTLMVRLSSLLFWFDESLQASVAAAGHKPLTRTQSLFLMCLAAGENRPSRLAEMLGVSRQAVSHVIAELTRRGLIRLVVDPEDARGRIVEYGFEAQDLRKLAHRVVGGLEALLEERIGAEAIGALRQGLAADWGAPAIVPTGLKPPKGTT